MRPGALPKIPRSNNLGASELAQGEQILVNGHQILCLSRNGSAQHGEVFGVTTSLDWNRSRVNLFALVPKVADNGRGIGVRKMELLAQFARDLIENVIRTNKGLVLKHFLHQFGTDPRMSN